VHGETYRIVVLDGSVARDMEGAFADSDQMLKRAARWANEQYGIDICYEL
jgi:hypothetical protein